MNKRKIRDCIHLLGALIFSPIYLIHILLTFFNGGKKAIGDANRIASRLDIRINGRMAVLYFLHNNEYFRSLFYHRIGPGATLLIGWWRPGCRSFIVPYSTQIGKNMLIAHSYSTVLNAESIGDNFSCIHCITLGKKGAKRPIIGNNVSMGAHSMVIGGVHVGDSAIIGAGAVVVKDVPANAIVVGNPARILRYRD